MCGPGHRVRVDFFCFVNCSRWAYVLFVRLGRWTLTTYRGAFTFQNSGIIMTKFRIFVWFSLIQSWNPNIVVLTWEIKITTACWCGGRCSHPRPARIRWVQRHLLFVIVCRKYVVCYLCGHTTNYTDVSLTIDRSCCGHRTRARHSWRGGSGWNMSRRYTCHPLHFHGYTNPLCQDCRSGRGLGRCWEKV